MKKKLIFIFAIYWFFLSFFWMQEEFDTQEIGEIEIHDIFHHQHIQIDQNLNLFKSSSLAELLKNAPQIQLLNAGSVEQIGVRGLKGARVNLYQGGIKQEEQAWSEDHGNLMSASGFTDIEILTPAAALIETGGGATLRILPPKIPLVNGLEQNLSFGYSFNNRLWYPNWDLSWRKDRIFIESHFLAQNFSDYQLAKNLSFVYRGKQYEFEDKNFINSAGYSYQFKLHVVQMFDHALLRLQTSFFTQKLGIFPLEELINLKPDEKIKKQSSKILDPYQIGQHFWFSLGYLSPIFNKKWESHWNLGFQWNERKEIEEEGETAHHLQLFNIQDRWVLSTFLTQKLKLETGWNTQYSYHQRAGEEYLLPSYHRLKNATFLVLTQKLGEKSHIHTGLRFEHDYFQSIAYAKYSSLEKNLFNYALALGIATEPSKNIAISVDFSKTYRAPEPIEWLADGVHHGALRVEKGDQNLKSEESVGLDLNIQANFQSLQLKLTPYVHYFWNYIYLKPTGEFPPIAGADQIYRYQQAPVLHAGFEIYSRLQLFPFVALIEQLSYVHLLNLETKYFIYQTPPWQNQLMLNFEFKTPEKNRFGFDVTYEYLHKQLFTEINEYATPTAHLFHTQIYAGFPIKKSELLLSLKGKNLFNHTYISALSHYKFLQIPEMGTNIQIQMSLKF